MELPAATAFVDYCIGHEGVRDVRINARCASAIVTYDERTLTSSDVQRVVHSACVAGMQEARLLAVIRPAVRCTRNACLTRNGSLVLGGALLAAAAIFLGVPIVDLSVALLAELLAPLIGQLTGHNVSSITRAAQLASGPGLSDLVVAAAKALGPADAWRLATDPVRAASDAVGKQVSTALSDAIESARRSRGARPRRLRAAA